MWKWAALLVFLLSSGVAAVARDNAASWLEVRSPNFVVITDGTEKQGRHIAGQFERMRDIFHMGFHQARLDVPAPILIIAVKDKKDFQSLEPETYLAKGQLDLAGLFLRAPEKNYVLLRVEAQGPHPYGIVYHEYTHLLMGEASQWLPLWLNEGLAQFFQNTDIHEKEVDLGQSSPDNMLLLRQNKLLPLDTLFKVDATSPYYHEEDKASIFYAESWAFVHLLEFSDQLFHVHRLADYVNMVSQHVDPVTAGERAFGDLPQMQKTLEAYISSGSMQELKARAPTDINEAAYQVTALPLPAANATLADFLAYNGREKDARALLDSVLKDDPQNVSAHETMGYLEFHAGNLDAARKWYEEAIQLDSKSYLAHYYYAVISMKSTAPVKQEDIEASLLAATKLNPRFAPAEDLLASFYAMHHEKLDQAHVLNLKATQVDPGNLQYRLDTASVLEEANRYGDALRVLKASAALANNPEEAATVRSRIQSLQHSQAQQEKEHSQQAAPEQAASSPTSTGRNVETSPAPAATAAPKHPTEEPTGPKHLANGVIQGVQCTDPSTIELKVAEGGKAISLYSNNYYNVEFSALNYKPDGEIHPCTDLEGMKASVQYAATSDKTIDGQILAVQLIR